MSECSPVISNNTPENNKPGSIGRPLENVEIRFEDGEILVKGTSVMKGYYQMPRETEETLKDGWLHTGDKGYIDKDGYLFINGRVKNLIILSNGENVSPEEIENKLALNPLVGEVIVTGEDNGLTARIYPEQAVVEAKALDTEMIRSQFQAFLDEKPADLPSHYRPGDPKKSVYPQYDKEDQETGCPDRRAAGIINTRLSESAQTVFLCLYAGQSG